VVPGPGLAAARTTVTRRDNHASGIHYCAAIAAVLRYA